MAPWLTTAHVNNGSGDDNGVVVASSALSCLLDGYGNGNDGA
jgi:hypothetical protein